MPSIAEALHDLLNVPALPVESALTRHFTDDYRQSTDGEWVDRAGFARQIEQLRTVVEHADIEVVDELVQGARYAERHVITVIRRDGVTAGQEVYLFGRIGGGGRFARLEELTRLLPSDRPGPAPR